MTDSSEYASNEWRGSTLSLTTRYSLLAYSLHYDKLCTSVPFISVYFFVDDFEFLFD